MKDDCVSNILGNHLTHAFIFVHMCEPHSRIFSLSQAGGGRCMMQIPAGCQATTVPWYSLHEDLQSCFQHLLLSIQSAF